MSRPYNKRRGGGPVLGGQHVGGGGARGGHTNNFSHKNINTNSRRNGRPAGVCGGRGGRLNGNSGGGVGGHGGGGGTNSGADLMKTLLSLLFEKNAGSFSEETGLLDLSSMRDCPDLANVSRSVDFNNVGFCKSLAEVLREKFANRIRIVKMDNNRIQRLAPLLGALADMDIHHGITAISAVGNEVSDLSFLGPLKGYGVLNEIYLLHNPIGSSNDYVAKVSRQLPNLNILDGKPIERRMLSLPNPVPTPKTNELGSQLLAHLDQNLLQWMNQGDMDRAATFYAPDAALSMSRYSEPIPARLPFNHLHNSATLDRDMKDMMHTDLTAIRHAIQWRNLATDVGSLSKVAKNPKGVLQALKSFTGTIKQSVRGVQVVDPSVNVTFMEMYMKTPICLITYHASMRYLWSPVDGTSGRRIFQEGKEPFLSLFVDRTLVLTQTPNGWACTNDMIFTRPDRFIVQEDNSSVSPIFFATTYDHIERMRRKLLPGGRHDVMQLLVHSSLSEYALQELMQRVYQLPADVQQSPEAVKSALGL